MAMIHWICMRRKGFGTRGYMVFVNRIKFCIVCACNLLVLFDVNLLAIIYVFFVCFFGCLLSLGGWLSVFFAIFNFAKQTRFSNSFYYILCMFVCIFLIFWFEFILFVVIYLKYNSRGCCACACLELSTNFSKILICVCI